MRLVGALDVAMKWKIASVRRKCRSVNSSCIASWQRCKQLKQLRQRRQESTGRENSLGHPSSYSLRTL